MNMKTNVKIAAAAVGGFVLGAGFSGWIGFAPGVLHAQGTAPSYEVAEINVTDQAGYEKSGVDKVRDGIKANGGKVIAGGYNKATARMGGTPPNRFLIIQWPNKETSEKAWPTAQNWWDSSGSKYASGFRDIVVDGIEQK
jgi:uncharacterized protein (DUF1330 family)